MRGASTAGSAPVVAAAAAAVVIAACLLRRPATAVAFAAVAAGGVWATPLKSAFDRPRPHLWRGVAHLSSGSFPSGHATQSAALALALLALAWRTRWRLLVAASAAVYVGLVGVSRLYLGVHYPSDVLGGWSVATLWALLVLAAARRWR